MEPGMTEPGMMRGGTMGGRARESPPGRPGKGPRAGEATQPPGREEHHLAPGTD